jgi:hypothetical protein
MPFKAFFIRLLKAVFKAFQSRTFASFSPAFGVDAVDDHHMNGDNYQPFGNSRYSKSKSSNNQVPINQSKK